MEKKFDIPDRLFKVTSNFNESQMNEHLPSFEITVEKESQFFEKREHLRKDISIYGIFETTDSHFRASTKNLSMGGILIDPETHLSLHEDMYMTLVHRKFDHPVRTHGKVIRVDSGGVGIQFDQVIPAMSSL